MSRWTWYFRIPSAIILAGVSYALIKLGLQGLGYMRSIYPEPLSPDGFVARYPFGMMALGLTVFGMGLFCITPPRLAPVWKWRYYEFATALSFIGAIGFAVAAILYDVNAQVVTR